MMMETEGSTIFEQDPGIPLITFSAVPGTCGIQVLDYNLDGNLDIILGIMDHIYLCLNNQDSLDLYYLGDLPSNDEGYGDDVQLGALTSADYNHDGKRDLILGGVQGVVRLCLNNFGQLPPFRPAIRQLSDFEPHKELEFGFVTKDINDDTIFYFVDWGDGTNSSWVGPYSSGEEIRLTHMWDEARTYWVKAKARDEHGAESEWKEYVLIHRKGKSCNRGLFDQSHRGFLGSCFVSDTVPEDAHNFVFDSLEVDVVLD
jgi:hypothetical protein